MAHGIALLFDAESDALVRRLWAALDEAGVPSLLAHSHHEHVPHMSLVVAEEISVGPWLARLREEIGGDPIEVGLRVPAAFAGPGRWLVLAATPTRRLLSVHEAVVGALGSDADRISEHYRPGHWVPHCTLAGGLDDRLLSEGIRIARSAELPVATIRAAVLLDSETGESRPLYSFSSGA